MSEPECLFCEKLSEAPPDRETHKVSGVTDAMGDAPGEHICRPCLDLLLTWKHDRNVMLLVDADISEEVRAEIYENFSNAFTAEVLDSGVVNAEAGGINE